MAPQKNDAQMNVVLSINRIFLQYFIKSAVMDPEIIVFNFPYFVVLK